MATNVGLSQKDENYFEQISITQFGLSCWLPDLKTKFFKNLQTFLTAFVLGVQNIHVELKIRHTGDREKGSNFPHKKGGVGITYFHTN